ncbi:MAG: putative Ig domain-containing protein [bacterium JZ-2024 1]
MRYGSCAGKLFIVLLSILVACGGGGGPGFSLIISAPDALPPGELREPYGPVTIVATGGLAPYTFSANQKPSWLVLHPQTGVLTGTPDAIGSFTVTIVATDSSNPPRSSGPRTYTLVVGDSRPPDTLFTSGPCNLQIPCFTNQTSSSFNFVSTEPASATFRCSFDGIPITPCIPPVVLPGPFSEGVHTFTVSAIDSANNIDPTPASFTWTVDLTPPGAPNVFNIIAGDERLVLQFSAPPDPDIGSYRIFRSTSPINDIRTCNCAIDVVPATGSPMEYRSRGLTNQVTYYHRIAAIDFAGNQGPASAERSGVSNEILISNTSVFPHRAASAFDNSRFFVIWDTDRNNNPFNPNYDILGAFVHPDGYLDTPPFSIVQGSASQQNPQVAFDPSGGYYLVVWEETDTGTSSILASRVGPNGSVMDPGGVLVVSGSAGFQHSPQVACTDSGCLIVWQSVGPQSIAINYARFFNGAVIGGPSTLYQLPVGDIPRRVSVTASRSLFLVTWSSAVEGDPFGMRVAWAGPQDASPVRLASGAGDQGRPLAAPLSPSDPNSSFLVVWEDLGTGSPDRNDIRGIVLPPSGPPSGEIGFSVGTPGKKELTAVTTSQTGFRGLIGWADYRDGPPIAPRIYYLRLILIPVPAPDGAEQPASGAHQQYRPRLSSGSARFLITWLDYRRTTDENNPIIDIYGHTVDE